MIYPWYLNILNFGDRLSFFENSFLRSPNIQNMTKVIVTFSLITFLVFNCVAQIPPMSGRLKVSIENVKCINKSFDGIVEFDGHGNEISFTYSYRIYKPSNPSAAKKSRDGTVIYGSNVNGMTKAGSQTPDLGGITNGNVVNIFKPILDEHIDAEDIVLIAPNVWEWDDPDKSRINAFNTKLDEDLDWALTQPYPFSNTEVRHWDMLSQIQSRAFLIYNKYTRYGMAFKYENIFEPNGGNVNSAGNRVIGLGSGTWEGKNRILFPPKIVALDTRILNGLSMNNINSGITGTSHAQKESQTSRIDGVMVTFTEETFAIKTNNGIYSVFLRIEFTPDKEPATTSSALSGQPTKTTIKNVPARGNINISNSTLAVAGRWTGTLTNDYGLYPQNIAFELTTNNEFLIKDKNGTLVAKGNYSFSNNVITGNYKQLSNSETFSFTGNLDAATQKMTCSQGSGTSTTDQGKWTVTKMGN
jgi:hypothetical protein